jgi:hypothetical protein
MLCKEALSGNGVIAERFVAFQIGTAGVLLIKGPITGREFSTGIQIEAESHGLDERPWFNDWVTIDTDLVRTFRVPPHRFRIGERVQLLHGGTTRPSTKEIYEIVRCSQRQLVNSNTGSNRLKIRMNASQKSRATQGESGPISCSGDR